MRTVLIANRGEIALRVIRACRDLRLSTVAVYTAEEGDAAHVQLADAAVELTGSTPTGAYLDGEQLIAAAARSGADAIHPGYGFLSESADFARDVQAAGLTWIGPGPDAIAQLADKAAARKLAASVGAPLLPATDGPVASADDVRRFVDEHGLPVVIKATLGGGGRGLRRVTERSEIESQLDSARREAQLAFGSGECIVERYLERVRHVEAQCLADAAGNVSIVSTRDCSLQRRSQKLIEEAPAPFLTDAQSTRIAETSEAILRAAGYVGAGTCEFLLDTDGEIYFLEVNARLQVEHSATEEATDQDLVVAQLRIASGETVVPGVVRAHRHAIEFRLNAEDPGRGFQPFPGLVRRLTVPLGPGIRWDGGVRAGDRVTTNFDSMLGKLIVTGRTREQALARARRAFEELDVDGVATVADFHRTVLDHPDFAGGVFAVHTRWIEQDLDIAFPPYSPQLAVPSNLGGAEPGATHEAAPAPARGDVLSPITATVLSIEVEPGQSVSAGDTIAVVEAMKMEQRVDAPLGGVVTRILATPGDAIPAGQVVATIDDHLEEAR